MPITKADKTKEFIIEKVAPYFNKHGYTGTSMSDITKATGLTKGAIYGNFENKEDLAIKAFNYTVKSRLGPIIDTINSQTTGLSKMRAFTDFYRNYYDYVQEYGGCPILNVGVDSLNHNDALYKRVVSVIGKMSKGIENVIRQAQQEGSVRSDINATEYASKIYAQVQGSIFLSVLTKSNENMKAMMDHIDRMIDNEMLA